MASAVGVSAERWSASAAPSATDSTPGRRSSSSGDDEDDDDDASAGVAERGAIGARGRAGVGALARWIAAMGASVTSMTVRGASHSRVCVQSATCSRIRADNKALKYTSILTEWRMFFVNICF